MLKDWPVRHVCAYLTREQRRCLLQLPCLAGEESRSIAPPTLMYRTEAQFLSVVSLCKLPLEQQLFLQGKRFPPSRPTRLLWHGPRRLQILELL